MLSIFGMLQKVFGDPSETERLAFAIEHLSDPQANHDEVTRGIDALGARRRPEDIDRLISMSCDRETPAHVHEWIAEALLLLETELEPAKVLLQRVGPKTREVLIEMLCSVYPQWTAELKASGQRAA